MLDLIKLSGEETGVADEFKMDWESQGIDFMRMWPMEWEGITPCILTL